VTAPISSTQVEAASAAVNPAAAAVDPAASYPVDTGLTLLFLLVVLGLPALVVMAVVATVLVRR